MEAPGTQTEAAIETTPSDPLASVSLKRLQHEVSTAIANRKEYLSTWRESVNYRVQKPFGAGSGDDAQDRVALPEDHARSKQKTAQLQFNLPKIVARACRPEFTDAAPVVQAAINDKLRREVQASYTVDEVLADVVNGAGLMVSKVGVDIYEEVIEPPAPAPSMDPTTGLPVTLPAPEPVKQIVARKFTWKRISPGAFLWPANFTGSNWDDAAWLGFETWMPIAQARKLYPKLPLSYSGGDAKPELLSADVLPEKAKRWEGTDVCVREIWYRAYLYDPAVNHPDRIRRVVYVDGHEHPVEHEDTDWQEWVPPVPSTPAIPATLDPLTGAETAPAQPAQPGRMGYFKGITRYPIRVGTLMYVSDLAVPPSDSEIGRPQVREMMESRAQMLQQRKSSIPIRWYDVNRLDETIATRMRNGEWNDMIPMNGPGDRAIGEVARANYPRENFQFDGIIGGNLDRAWSLSNNQLSALNSGDRTAAEINSIRSAGDVRLDYEKARVNRYVVEACEVLFSLMQLFMGDTDYVEVIGEQAVPRLQAYTRASIQGAYAFDFVADSSERIDLATKQTNVLKMYNLLGNSPTTNRAELERQIWELHGFDAARMTVKPEPKAPETPNISYRFGGEDLLNPFALALMMKAHPEIGPEQIKAAALLIKDSMDQVQWAAQQPPKTPEGTPPAGAPPAPVAPGRRDVEPPETPSPILKRAINGDRLT